MKKDMRSSRQPVPEDAPAVDEHLGQAPEEEPPAPVGVVEATGKESARRASHAKAVQRQMGNAYATRNAPALDEADETDEAPTR